MTADLIYLCVGTALLASVLLPRVSQRYPVPGPIVLLLMGAGFGLFPVADKVLVSLTSDPALLEHATELTVVVALMGVGLSLDRPLELRNPEAWRCWGATWRLLLLTMPLCIAGVALLGWSLMGLAPAAALLLGAVLAPTDPVLASDVQVSGPTTALAGEDALQDEEDEVRFALTSEAGLNDGLAFPFVYAAIFLVSLGSVTEWGLRWVAWELGGKVVIGVAVGTAMGWLLAKLAFRIPSATLRLADTGEPLAAVAAVLLSYGAAELAQGYGFLAVFACAMTLRMSERGHDYNAAMHTSIERLERLLTLTVLLVLGAALSNSLLADLTWQGATVGALLVLVVRPAAAWFSLRVGPMGKRAGARRLTAGEEVATAWFGVRGVGSLYYLAYAAGQAQFPGMAALWSTVGFTIALSVVLHGITATPTMQRLELTRAERV